MGNLEECLLSAGAVVTASSTIGSETSILGPEDEQWISEEGSLEVLNWIGQIQNDDMDFESQTNPFYDFSESASYTEGHLPVHEQITHLSLTDSYLTENLVGNHLALHSAARQPGGEAMVREILDSGVDVNARDGSHMGMTALHCAAETPGCEAIVKLLLKRGANVHAKTSDRETALHFAVAHSKDMVQQLLKKGARINQNEGSVLFAAVCVPNNESVVALLLKNGADINKRVDQYPNVLHYAIGHRGNDATIRLLLNKGADVNSKGEYGGTALHDAANRGYFTKVRLLLRDAAVRAGRSSGRS